MIKDQSELKVGDSVHYQPSHYGPNKFENGVVKEIPEHTATSVRVVYNCNGEWHRYTEFTSAMTALEDLHKGWR
jgi:hypothetical protein